MASSLEDKVRRSREVILKGVEKFGEDKIATAWTGGKDSIVLLHLIRETFRGRIPIPVVFIDTGKHFPEVYQLRNEIAEK